jgi:phage terminase small subunit
MTKVSNSGAGLTQRRQVFVKEYLTDFNGKRSAIAAGYSENGAEVSASRLLRDANVKAAIEQGMKERCDKLDIKAENVLAELAKIGFANMLDYLTINGSDACVDFSRLTRAQAAAIQEVTSDVYLESGEGGAKVAVKRTKFKLADKPRALELMGRHLKMFTDKVDIAGGGFVLINGITKPKGGSQIADESPTADPRTETHLTPEPDHQDLNHASSFVLVNGITGRKK